ncbi:hypothetical protein BC938DRAFT_480449 [Jimgerdemannia flammicorona]|uniref:Acyl-CoA dehydrogenase/oxidase N-terminal domain-containing protein n=1 Tax=Jimgerdemannia flammicorona TaxID=994334 RepID=A0A433QJ48_9FUNG|nr:hypothetical protein BC938DRAFT_480449 [Jimgerdemannia flammicorona]
MAKTSPSDEALTSPFTARGYFCVVAEGGLARGDSDTPARRFLLPSALQLELARKFTLEEIIPLPLSMIGQALSCREYGLVNTHIPAGFGGSGLCVLDDAIVTEELADGCRNVDVMRNRGGLNLGDMTAVYRGIQTAIEANGLTEAPLIVAGPKQKIPPYGGLLRHGAMGRGDSCVINGQKMWITNGGKANWYFVLAKTNAKASTGKAFTGFVVADTIGNIC